MKTYAGSQVFHHSLPQVLQKFRLAPFARLTANTSSRTGWNTEHTWCCGSHRTSYNPWDVPAKPLYFRTAASSPTSQQTAPRRSSHKRSSHDSSNWQQVLQDSLDPQQLIKIVLRGKITAKPDQLVAHVSRKGIESNSSSNDDSSSSEQCPATAAAPAGFMPYKQLTIRPVMLKGNVMLQFSLLDSRQDITKNYSQQQAVQQLQQLLQLAWHSATLQTHASTTTVQISRKGKVLVQTTPLNSTAAARQEPAASSSSSSSGCVSPQQQQQQRSGGLAPVQAASDVVVALQHDRVKALPVNGNIADPFLQQIGLQTADGRIKASMQAKFTQINEFLKLLIHTGKLDCIGQQQQQAGTAASQSSSSSSSEPSSSSSSASSSPVHILDCGCGSSHLTFGTYHYLTNVLGRRIRLTGIDTNKALMERSNSYCKEIGIEQHAQFHTAAIRDYQLTEAPDIVLALHACDTATDDALAVGVRSGAAVILSVPCCHKDLHRQYQQQQQQQQVHKQKGSPSVGHNNSSSSGGGVDSSGSCSDSGVGTSSSTSSSAELFDPLLSHGILRQRMLDLLTDTFRAHLLRLVGYRTDVVEFVSTEHTPRNLLIRAVKQQRQLPDVEQMRLATEYVQLRNYWGVSPKLEKLLREDGLLPAALLQLDA